MQTRAMIGREGRAPGGGGARRGIGKFLERISSITTNVMPQCSLYQSPHPSLDLVRLYLLLNGPWGDAVDALQTRNQRHLAGLCPKNQNHRARNGNRTAHLAICATPSLSLNSFINVILDGILSLLHDHIPQTEWTQPPHHNQARCTAQAVCMLHACRDKTIWTSPASCRCPEGYLIRRTKPRSPHKQL